MKLWDLMESPVASVPDLRRRTTMLAVIHVVLGGLGFMRLVAAIAVRVS